MSSIGGRISGALSSFHNENNVSLANFNVDFALVRVEAPAEFQSVGRALTRRRRQVAEEGTHHRTARCLGALFAAVIPPAPLLVRAFGSRTSEILESPHANPKGTTGDGPFAEYVGADATSIWASATSGVASIAVLLLACMLARKFDDSRLSVAVWVELVNTRQKDLAEYAQVNGSIADQVVAQQRILREDLAMFDDSVRAWLNTADAVMLKQRKQLELILHNLTSVPVSSGDTTYKKVMKAWRDAMEGFEALLAGKPQNATETSVLLALSAWHLYPNLIVLSDKTAKKVDFRDHLVPQSGAITVGLQLSDVKDNTPGFRWSLALSHLKYYGEAVKVEIGTDNVRINIHDLGVIAFGALLRRWKVAHSATAIAAECVQEIGRLLDMASRDALHTFGVATPNTSNDWFHGVLSAAESVTLMLKDEAKRCNKLAKYGRQRYQNFFKDSLTSSAGVFFGLSNPHVLKAMSLPPGRERELLYCRSQLADVGQKDAIVVVYRHSLSIMGSQPIVVVATVHPVANVSGVNKISNQQEDHIHSRWVFYSEVNTNSGLKSKTDAEIMSQLEIPSDEIVKIFRISPGSDSPWLRIDKKGSSITWNHAPSIFCRQQTPLAQSSGIDEKNWCMCLDGSTSEDRMDVDSTAEETAVFERVCGNEHTISLYATNYHSSHQDQSERESALFGYMQAESVRAMQPALLLDKLKQEPLDKRSLAVYFIHLSRCGITTFSEAIRVTMDPAGKTPGKQSKCTDAQKPSHPQQNHRATASNEHTTWYDQLRRLDMGQGGLSLDERDLWGSIRLISMVFEKLSGSTFPIKVADRQFPRVVNHISTPYGHGTHLSLTLDQTFACIATMESGGVSVSPTWFQHAFALSVGNSLYAAKCLLEDPLTSTPSHEVKRILGNLGRPGLSILVSPETPRIKEETSFHAVEHATYDGRRVDSFQGVSLHLSLTEWKVPHQHDSIGLIDQDIFTTEAVISVHDRGQWYADIDVLRSLPCIRQLRSCVCMVKPQHDSEDNLCVSIDTLDELIDFPQENPGVVRAHRNWAARLAACCIIRQRLNLAKIYVTGEAAPCSQCLSRTPTLLSSSQREHQTNTVDLVEKSTAFRGRTMAAVSTRRGIFQGSASSESSSRGFSPEQKMETSSEFDDLDSEDENYEALPQYLETEATYLPIVVVD